MQLYYWIALNLVLFIAMWILVPVERIRQLFVYGLVGGTGLAIIVFGIAHALNLWETIGSVMIGEYIALMPSIAWFFPVVIFGNYFPKKESLFLRAGFVLLFALGSVVSELFFDYLGMWRNIHWNVYYTFVLATFTHTLLAVYIMYTEQYLPE